MDNIIKIVAVLVDDPNSWFVKYAELLCDKLLGLDINAKLYHSITDIPVVDVCFMLSCTKIVKKEFLDRNKHNIVVHPSDLPRGKGITPMKWQILEGKNDIPLTLFEAVEACDAGPFYFKEYIHFEGYELLDDLQSIMAMKIIEMCIRFVCDYQQLKPQSQVGDSTYYPRFKKDDNCLDVNKTIAEHFIRFRKADNSRCPLYFIMQGHKYEIVISEIGEGKLTSFAQVPFIMVA